MTTYCLAPRGEDRAARAVRIRQYEEFFNPSGLATPDDATAYEDCQAGNATPRHRLPSGLCARARGGAARRRRTRGGTGRPSLDLHRRRVRDGRRDRVSRNLSHMAQPAAARARTRSREGRTRREPAPRLARTPQRVLFEEARALDEQRFDDWLALYAHDAIFWVPAWTDEGRLTSDPETELSLIHCTRAQLAERVGRVEGGRSIASSPLPRTAHIVSNVMVGSLAARSSCASLGGDDPLVQHQAPHDVDGVRARHARTRARGRRVADRAQDDRAAERLHLDHDGLLHGLARARSGLARARQKDGLAAAHLAAFLVHPIGDGEVGGGGAVVVGVVGDLLVAGASRDARPRRRRRVRRSCPSR